MANNIVYLRADPAYFNPAMFSQDLLYNALDGTSYQVITMASDSPTQEPVFTYLTPEQSTGNVGQEIIVADNLEDYKARYDMMATQASDVVDLPRAAIAVMAATGLHIFFGYSGDVWRYTSTDVALRGNDLTKEVLDTFLPVGTAVFIGIDDRGNWTMYEKPMGHVYRKETEVPEEIVRHILVEEILKSYDVRTH